MRRSPLALALALVTACALASPALASPARASSTAGRVDFRANLQAIDGFGFSQAFQRADVMHGAQGLSEAHQREVLDLLLSRSSGAGLSIL
ncbi:MAG TPA: hypothetical protein VGO89_05480, partial [Streptomyces sp.]|nr:hypothetical protein [Streptomyces sp.]